MAEEFEGASIAGVVDRPRLYRVLDSPLVRVCIVQGPSGCGKTTLVRSWALQQGPDAPVTWVSLSGDVTSRQAFWEHVAGSASRLGDLAEETAAQIKEQLSRAADPARVAGEILADAGPVAIVLDAYEHLGDVMPEIDRDLAQLVAATPELRLIITTRGNTRLADLQLPDGVVRMMTLRELAFTTDEIRTLIASQTGIDDEQLTASIAGATQGFALTVRAVVLTLSQLGAIPRLDSAEWNAVLAARLESLLPDRTAVQFVTDTSVPPYVDVELSRLLSGNADAEGLLAMLERNGFGRWIPYARHRPVFQYVEAIRDTFRARARDDPERYRRGCVTSAAWLLENEEVVDQALQFAIDGGDYALADRIFLSVVISNPASYTSDRYLAALSEVPEEALGDYPLLAFGLSLALLSNPIRRGEGPRVAQIAVESKARPSYVEPSLDAFAMASMQAIARRLTGRFRDSAAACLEVLDSAAAIDAGLLPLFSEHVGTILRQVSYSLLQGGRIDEAMAVISRSVALCPTPTTRDYSTVYAAGFNAFTGDLGRARTLSASIDTDAWPVETRKSYMNGLGLVADGYACLDALDFAGAAEVLRDAESYIQTAEFWPFLTGVSVVARHGLGQARAEAERVTRELAAAVPPHGVGDNVATEHLHAVLALSGLAAGDQRQAAQALEGQPIDSPYLASARVAVLLAAGRDAEALRLARRLLELPGHTIRTLAETQTVGAVAALRQGDAELAWTWLSAGAVTWEAYGPRLHVALLAPRDRRLLWEFGRERQSAGLQRYLDIPVSEGQGAGLAAVSLTGREQVVLAALADHEGARAIAEALVVSPHTIKTQLQSIYRKLGVSSREAALAVARELGLLDRSE
ncbi:MAG: NACHT domain-containing protein [Propionibacteriaceae bacterium]|nr:NACHT domain-containing protein [Propionibacteriaceae bacterium]